MPNILIVDDEAYISTQLKERLTSMGYNVVGVASSGETAIDMAGSLHPDLVLMDIVMPGKLDGIAAAQIIKEKLDIPVIFLSAYTDDKFIERAKNVEPLGYIVKPFQEGEIKATIEVAVYKKEMEKALQRAHDELERRVEKRTAELAKANEELQKEIAERKQAEKALQRTKKELETIVDSVPALISYKDTNNRYIHINKTYAEAINLPRDHIEGKSAFDIASRRELAEKYWQDDKAVIASGVPKRNIIEPILFDDTRTGQTDKIPYLDDKGNIIGVIVFCIDTTSRVRAEKALKESEEKYRTLFENASEAIYVAQDGKFKFLNPKTEEIYGYSAEELTSKPFTYFMHEKDKEMLLERHKKRLRGETPPSTYPFRIVNKAGDTKWVENHVVMFSWENKPATLSFVTDINKRVHAEKALKESEERYRSLVDNVPVAVYRTTPGPKGKYLMANPAFLKMFGLESEEELKELSVADVYMNPKDRKAFSDDLLAKGSVDRVELALKKKDGTPFWGSASARVVYVEGGKTYFFDCTIMDITARKQAEETLRQSEERFREMADLLPTIIGELDLDSQLTYTNKAGLKTFGYSQEDLEAGLNVVDMVHPDDRERTLKNMKKAIKGKKLDANEYRMLKKDGSELAVLLHSGPIYKSGKVVGIRSTLTDITQIKRTEKALREREAELEIKTNSLEEVNTALRVLLRRREEDKIEIEEKVLLNVRELVVPFLERLKKSQLDPKQLSYTDILESNLNDIISPFSRTLSAKYLSLTPREIQIANLIKLGKSTKDIGELMALSPRTIETHRKSLRKKLGLDKKKRNLRSRLLTFQ